MTIDEYLIRQSIRNFLLTATLEELRRELQISIDWNENFRADCIRELIDTY